jgi:hypothetical protein
MNKENFYRANFHNKFFDYIILFAHLAFLFLTLFFLIIKIIDSIAILTPILFAFSELIFWYLRERKYNKKINWMHPVPIFVISYCITFYQLPLCYYAGYELSFYSIYVIFSPENIPYCVLIAALGLSSFFLAEHLVFLMRKGQEKKYYNSDKNYIDTIKKGRQITFLSRTLLLFIILIFLLFLKSLGGLEVFFKYPYSDASMMPIASLYYQLALFILIYNVILLQLSKINFNQKKNFIGYILSWDGLIILTLIIIMIPFILSGDRGTYLQLGMLLIAPYFIIIKPLRFKEAIIIFIIMVFFLSLIGEIRGGKISINEAFISKVKQLSNPGKWPTLELANSFGTFNIATYLFPKVYRYNYGLGILFRVAGFIPFFNRFMGLDKINIEKEYVYNSSSFFTYIINRGNMTSGAGTSCLADIYIEFGPWGIPVILFLWGLFIGWISIKIRTKATTNTVFLYSYLAYFAIYVNRSSFLFGWNAILWAFLIYFIIKKIFLVKY